MAEFVSTGFGGLKGPRDAFYTTGGSKLTMADADSAQVNLFANASADGTQYSTTSAGPLFYDVNGDELISEKREHVLTALSGRHLTILKNTA